MPSTLSGTGTTVNTVSTGLIHTPEVEAYYRKRAAKKGWGDNWADTVNRFVAEDFPKPSQRIARRADIADLVAFIASTKADLINGQNIRVDGGAVNLFGFNSPPLAA